MKKILTFILVALISLNVFSNSGNQRPDKLIYNGKEYSLNYYPLEDFFKKNPDKKPKSVLRSTNLWRGYLATFEFSNNQLFLKDIEILEYDSLSIVKHEPRLDSIKDIKFPLQYNTKLKSVFNTIFPNQTKLKIDWVTKLLVLPHGEKKNNPNFDYDEHYEMYFLLEIYKGELKKEKNFNFEAFEIFKDEQFEALKKTKNYREIKKEIRNTYKSVFNPKSNINKSVDYLIRKFIMDYISEI